MFISYPYRLKTGPLPFSGESPPLTLTTPNPTNYRGTIPGFYSWLPSLAPDLMITIPGYW